ncbi:MAG: LemA family protein [Chloroflexi bacterium]|nr:LemA family protein [Chloroflexota bacterium]
MVGLLVIVVAIVAAMAVMIYNGLVGGRNRVQNAWSQIDVQLKRRHDLIPNLVNAVKGYMQHERDILERVTQARANAIAAGNDVAARADAENQLTGALRSLFAVAEAYPQLRANENMLALQEELTSTENRVAFSRQAYNDAVMEYNTSQQTFPAVLFAASLGFRPADPFAIENGAERAAPTVSF